MAEMGAKINVFKDPFMDRATEAEDLMAKIRALNGDEGSENLSTADRAVNRWKIVDFGLSAEFNF